MKRTDIINLLIDKHHYKSYLEIGVRNPKDNFDKINIQYKAGVDPGYESPRFSSDYRMTSDDFFAQNKQTFDIIFIDGLHESEQVYKDVLNSLACLNKNGTIVCHDMKPLTEQSQIFPDPRDKLGPISWNGDCWKAWIKLRSTRDDLKMYVVDTDHGVGIITRGRQELCENISYEWDEFKANQPGLLNLISIDQFKNIVTA